MKKFCKILRRVAQLVTFPCDDTSCPALFVDWHPLNGASSLFFSILLHLQAFIHVAADADFASWHYLTRLMTYFSDQEVESDDDDEEEEEEDDDDEEDDESEEESEEEAAPVSKKRKTEAPAPVS